MLDFVKYHLRQAVRASVAEANGDQGLARRLNAQTKLRLMCMPDEELWELARLTSSPERPVEVAVRWELSKLTSSPPERPVELVYKGIKQAIEEHRATASEWIPDLVKRPIPDKEGKDTDRILIIEGEPALRRELASALTQASFTVADVANFPEALLKLDFSPHMAIVDEVLPGGDGFEACSQLHGALGIPVILLGKHSSGEAWTRAVEAGADFYFRKPFSYLELVARVRAILCRYKKTMA